MENSWNGDLYIGMLLAFSEILTSQIFFSAKTSSQKAALILGTVFAYIRGFTIIKQN